MIRPGQFERKRLLALSLSGHGDFSLPTTKIAGLCGALKQRGRASALSRRTNGGFRRRMACIPIAAQGRRVA
jgi:hypothetical protein